jgi:hypothetical protein
VSKINFNFKDESRLVAASCEIDNHQISKQKLSQLCTKRSRELVDSSDSIICLDDSYQEDNMQTANGEIEPVKEADIDAIHFLSEEEVSLSKHEVGNQQPCQFRVKTTKKRQTEFKKQRFSALSIDT